MHNRLSTNFNIIPEDNLRQILLLIIFAGTMLFVRIAPTYSLIFTDWPGDYGKFVNFAADDAVYHMRLVHNTIYHFPLRVFFDPFTHFPYGNQVHFGPLFTLIIASAALIAGLGHPTPELINIVGAYTPVVMGVLCLIPLYFIARTLFGKTAAIITVFILTFLPGEFLQRSNLGFTDHHVAEVLFSTITCAFLICALNEARINRIFLVYSLLSGISFGLFVLVWPAALMFGAIFLIFFITQLTIDHLKNNNPEYLLFLVTIIYSIPAIMVLPYALMNPHFELSYYSLTQPIILLAMAATFFVCYLAHLACKRHQLTKDLYSIVLTAIFILTIFILHRYAPKLYVLAQDGCKMLFEPTSGMRTVSEVRPSIINQSGNKLTITRLWFTYFWTMPLAIIGLGHLFYRTYKNTRPAEVLLLTWSIAVILAAIAQCRFNYYLAINIAILAGCYSFYPFLNLLGKLKPNCKLHFKLQKTAIYTSFCIFAFLIIVPILMFLMDRTMPSGIQITRQRYDTYMWLKKHTPDPQGKIIKKDFDYAAGYYPIPKDPNLPYNYPKSAYGIMAWWEIGHQITYIAERIPNTNPFQQGIIEKNKATGAALFFTSADEKKAVENLDIMGSKYIFIDNKTSNNIGGISVWYKGTENWTTYIKHKITLPQKTLNIKIPIDSAKFHQSMLNKLFYNDANGLQHFRLIYESGGDYLVMLRRAIFKPYFYVDAKILNFKNYKDALKFVTDANRMYWANKEKTVFIHNARNPVKGDKIFEKVKGATINGEVSKDIADGTRVNLTLKLKTKFDRIFTYEQTTEVKNGKYSFIVPYPTAAMRGDGYSYDIKPIGPYQIQIGSKVIEVLVTEEAVMIGKTIKLSSLVLNTRAGSRTF